ncbi:hypothetical protein KQ875_01965 [Mycoplasma zalophi]|uniref:Lipoprotein-associated type-17 domain-containing protein n=1 Tax=Mycoplasma zalophi TaxID=191287 RepID=A0ABS6DPW2_9MOLU|nr:lipoprotein 17-related variable surface protein [Mycoplasma zalophi]MBU4692360.1 hypothetical protein [Mycoplasma zalophi]
MKKKKIILCTATMSILTLSPIALYSCAQPNIVNPNALKENEQEKKESPLDTYLKSKDISLNINNINNVFASDINYTNITLKNKDNNQIIFQIQNMISSDENGSLTIKYYVRQKDNQNIWQNSNVITKTITGFKTISKDINQEINNLSIDVAEELKQFLPSQITTNTTNFQIKNYNNENYLLDFVNIEAKDNEGNIDIILKLKSKFKDSIVSNERKVTLNNFLTTDKYILNNLNSEFSKINKLELKDDINKQETKASKINKESDFKVIDNEKYNVIINSLTTNDETGELTINFKIQSKENSNIQTEPKELIINNFLTNNEDERQQTLKYLNSLGKLYTLKDAQNKENTLPSDVNDDQILVNNLAENVEIIAKQITKNNDLGTINIEYKLQKFNESLKENIITKPITEIISGFLTTRQKEINEEKQRLTSISEDKNNYFKNDGTPLSKTYIEELNIEDLKTTYETINFKLDNIKTDENWKNIDAGTITFNADIISLKPQFSDLVFNKTITISGLQNRNSLEKMEAKIAETIKSSNLEYFNSKRDDVLMAFSTENSDQTKKTKLEAAKKKIEDKNLKAVYDKLDEKINEIAKNISKKFVEIFGYQEKEIEIYIQEILKSLQSSSTEFLKVFVDGTEKHIANPEKASWTSNRFFRTLAIPYDILSRNNLDNFGNLTANFFEHIKTTNNQLNPLNKLLLSQFKFDSDFENITDLDNLITGIVEIIEKNNNKMLDDLKYDSNDWLSIFFGIKNNQAKFNNSHIAKVFPEGTERESLRDMGRTWLLTGGWNILFATKKYEQFLEKDIDAKLSTSNLNSQQKEKIKNKVKEIFSLYTNLVDQAQQNIYKLSQNDLLNNIKEVVYS